LHTILYLELNIFPLAVLGIIFYYMKHRSDQLLLEQKLFLGLILLNALILAVDTVMWLTDGQPGAAFHSLNTVGTVVYYFLNPLICFMWYCYVDFYIHRDTGRLKKRLLPMFVPALVNIALTIASLYSNILFYIDADNVYHRGRFFLVMAAISLFYLMYSMILAILHQKLIPKQDVMPIVFFMIPPLIGGVIQTMIYGVSLIWPCATLSILVVYITIQNNQLYTDHLTGLFNRRQLDRYLQYKVQAYEEGLLAGLMIDLDSFKSINDQFGHHVGDQALIDTSEILKRTFRKNDFVARFGGDEFVIIMSVRDNADLQRAIDRLHENIAFFNSQKIAPYILSLSVGYDALLDKSDKSAKAFLAHLDELMYRSKQHSGNKP
jgi:diguanylate cyclase (GGDEF)-like protein